MRRSHKTALQYMLFVWLFTTCLAFIVNCNGKDGLQGTPGKDGVSPAPNPLDIVEVIDPCGEESDRDEILLRLRDGSLLAHYSDGQKQFFALIGPGSYRTTDGTACVFNISADLMVTWGI